MDANLGHTSGHKLILSVYTIKRFTDFGFLKKVWKLLKNVYTYGDRTFSLTDSSLLLLLSLSVSS
jgi:uncharacterized protein (DUF608 family)